MTSRQFTQLFDDVKKLISEQSHPLSDHTFAHYIDLMKRISVHPGGSVEDAIHYELSLYDHVANYPMTQGIDVTVDFEDHNGRDCRPACSELRNYIIHKGLLTQYVEKPFYSLMHQEIVSSGRRIAVIKNIDRISGTRVVLFEQHDRHKLALDLANIVMQVYDDLHHKVEELHRQYHD